jgi:hypothetical protein
VGTDPYVCELPKTTVGTDPYVCELPKTTVGTDPYVRMYCGVIANLCIPVCQPF